MDALVLECRDAKEIGPITTPRRSYSAEYKAKVALEALKGLRHRLPPTLRRLVDGMELPPRFGHIFI